MFVVLEWFYGNNRLILVLFWWLEYEIRKLKFELNRSKILVNKNIFKSIGGDICVNVCNV